MTFHKLCTSFARAGEGMKRPSMIIFAILFSLLPLGAYLVYFLPPSVARLALISIFLMPIFLITYHASKGLGRRETKVLATLAFFAIPSFVFMIGNVNRFPLFLEGIESSATRVQAELYNEHGAITFSTSHSFFFQTPFLMYVISNVCGISITHASILIIALHITMMALVSLYIARIIMKSIPRPELSFLPYLIVFSLFSSINMMFTNVCYRYLGSVLLLLFLFFYYDKNCGEKPRRAFSIVTLILTVGITLGDPTAALLMILLFVLVSILGKNASASLYAIIPFSYMFYVATSYLLLIKSYTTFAWEGFMDFFQEIFVGGFPERVVPWQRVIMPTVQDTYVTSAAYISLLFVSASVGLFYAVLWMLRKNERDVMRRNTLIRANCLSLLVMVAIASATYVGASVNPEVPFSDIRTIVMVFVSTLILFSFASKTLLAKFTTNRIILAIIIVLLVLSSLRVVYEAYPKSFYDPINVVEDTRLDRRSNYYVRRFLNAFYVNGSIASDYKTRPPKFSSFQSELYKISLLNNGTLNDPKNTFIIFNMNGLRFKSIYTSSDVYIQAYHSSLTQNIVYNSGNITVIKR